MKQCPVCKTSYTDDTLSFCLSDGASLVTLPDEEQTVIRNQVNGPLRVDFSPEAEPTNKVLREPATNKSARWIKILIAAVVLGALAIAVLGFAGIALYYGRGERASEQPSKTPAPAPTQTPTPDTEKERLKDEIANIQKQLEDQKRRASTPAAGNTDEPGSPVTATVDSPNDGFLALRSLPDADRGERLAKIPDGAEVEILNCEKTAVTIGSRTGRWCQVDYDGQTGWVFDAWLDY